MAPSLLLSLKVRASLRRRPRIHRSPRCAISPLLPPSHSFSPLHPPSPSFSRVLPISLNFAYLATAQLTATKEAILSKSWLRIELDPVVINPTSIIGKLLVGIGGPRLEMHGFGSTERLAVVTIPDVSFHLPTNLEMTTFTAPLNVTLQCRKVVDARARMEYTMATGQVKFPAEGWRNPLGLPIVLFEDDGRISVREFTFSLGWIDSAPEIFMMGPFVQVSASFEMENVQLAFGIQLDWRALLPPFRPKTGGLFLQSRAPFTAYDLTFFMIRLMGGPDAVNKTRTWDVIPHFLKNASIDAFTGTICLNSFTFAAVGSNFRDDRGGEGRSDAQVEGDLRCREGFLMAGQTSFWGLVFKIELAAVVRANGVFVPGGFKFKFETVNMQRTVDKLVAAVHELIGIGANQTGPLSTLRLSDAKVHFELLEYDPLFDYGRALNQPPDDDTGGEEQPVMNADGEEGSAGEFVNKQLREKYNVGGILLQAFFAGSFTYGNFTVAFHFEPEFTKRQGESLFDAIAGAWPLKVGVNFDASAYSITMKDLLETAVMLLPADFPTLPPIPSFFEEIRAEGVRFCMAGRAIPGICEQGVHGAFSLEAFGVRATARLAGYSIGDIDLDLMFETSALTTRVMAAVERQLPTEIADMATTFLGFFQVDEVRLRIATPAPNRTSESFLSVKIGSPKLCKQLNFKVDLSIVSEALMAAQRAIDDPQAIADALSSMSSSDDLWYSMLDAGADDADGVMDFDAIINAVGNTLLEAGDAAADALTPDVCTLGMFVTFVEGLAAVSGGLTSVGLCPVAWAWMEFVGDVRVGLADQAACGHEASLADLIALDDQEARLRDLPIMAKCLKGYDFTNGLRSMVVVPAVSVSVDTQALLGGFNGFTYAYQDVEPGTTEAMAETQALAGPLVTQINVLLAWEDVVMQLAEATTSLRAIFDGLHIIDPTAIFDKARQFAQPLKDVLDSLAAGMPDITAPLGGLLAASQDVMQGVEQLTNTVSDAFENLANLTAAFTEVAEAIAALPLDIFDGLDILQPLELIDLDQVDKLMDMLSTVLPTVASLAADVIPHFNVITPEFIDSIKNVLRTFKTVFSTKMPFDPLSIINSVGDLIGTVLPFLFGPIKSMGTMLKGLISDLYNNAIKAPDVIDVLFDAADAIKKITLLQDCMGVFNSLTQVAGIPFGALRGAGGMIQRVLDAAAKFKPELGLISGFLNAMTALGNSWEHLQAPLQMIQSIGANVILLGDRAMVVVNRLLDFVQLGPNFMRLLELPKRALTMLLDFDLPDLEWPAFPDLDAIARMCFDKLNSVKAKLVRVMGVSLPWVDPTALQLALTPPEWGQLVAEINDIVSVLRNLDIGFLAIKLVCETQKRFLAGLTEISDFLKSLVPEFDKGDMNRHTANIVPMNATNSTPTAALESMVRVNAETPKAVMTVGSGFGALRTDLVSMFASLQEKVTLVKDTLLKPFYAGFGAVKDAVYTLFNATEPLFDLFSAVNKSDIAAQKIGELVSCIPFEMDWMVNIDFRLGLMVNWNLGSCGSSRTVEEPDAGLEVQAAADKSRGLPSVDAGPALMKVVCPVINLAQWAWSQIQSLMDTIRSFMPSMDVSLSPPNIDLPPLDKIILKPKCMASDKYCMNIKPRQSILWDLIIFPLKYIQFWDLSQPTANPKTGDKTDPCQFVYKPPIGDSDVRRLTIPGLWSGFSMQSSTMFRPHVSNPTGIGQCFLICCTLYNHLLGYQPNSPNRNKIDITLTSGMATNMMPLELRRCFMDQGDNSFIALTDPYGLVWGVHIMRFPNGEGYTGSVHGIAAAPQINTVFACGREEGDAHWSVFSFNEGDFKTVSSEIYNFANEDRWNQKYEEKQLIACGVRTFQDTQLAPRRGKEKCTLAWEPRTGLLWLGTIAQPGEDGWALAYRPSGTGSCPGDLGAGYSERRMAYGSHVTAFSFFPDVFGRPHVAITKCDNYNKMDVPCKIEFHLTEEFGDDDILLVQPMGPGGCAKYGEPPPSKEASTLQTAIRVPHGISSLTHDTQLFGYDGHEHLAGPGRFETSFISQTPQNVRRSQDFLYDTEDRIFIFKAPILTSATSKRLDSLSVKVIGTEVVPGLPMLMTIPMGFQPMQEAPPSSFFEGREDAPEVNDFGLAADGVTFVDGCIKFTTSYPLTAPPIEFEISFEVDLLILKISGEFAIDIMSKISCELEVCMEKKKATLAVEGYAHGMLIVDIEGEIYKVAKGGLSVDALLIQAAVTPSITVDVSDGFSIIPNFDYMVNPTEICISAWSEYCMIDFCQACKWGVCSPKYPCGWDWQDRTNWDWECMKIGDGIKSSRYNEDESGGGDTTPPDKGVVEVVAQPTPTRISVTFSAFIDPESDIRQVTFRLQSYPRPSRTYHTEVMTGAPESWECDVEDVPGHGARVMACAEFMNDFNLSTTGCSEAWVWDSAVRRVGLEPPRSQFGNHAR